MQRTLRDVSRAALAAAQARCAQYEKVYEPVDDERDGAETSYVKTGDAATSYKLRATSYTLQATRYTLHATRYILHATRYTLHPTPYTLHATRYTLHAKPRVCRRIID